MEIKSIDVSITQIANDTGLNKAEISMALNAKRLLNREKLRKIVNANYPLEPFIFGKSYIKNDTKQQVQHATAKGA